MHIRQGLTARIVHALESDGLNNELYEAIGAGSADALEDGDGERAVGDVAPLAVGGGKVA